MLDINTPRGQQSLHEELEMAALFEAANPGYSYIKTDKTGTATVDAMLIKYYNNSLIGLAEAKCRNMTLAQLAAYDYLWLVTADKLDDAAKVACALGTPLWGFLYLTPEQTLLTKRLYCPTTGWLVPLTIKTTTTQATINGADPLWVGAIAIYPK